MDHLLPCPGALIRSHKHKKIGTVKEIDRGSLDENVLVQWNGSGRYEWVRNTDLTTALYKGAHVIHIPSSPAGRSLGEGIVKGFRKIGGRQQVLVDFLESGTLIWSPYENLGFLIGIKERAIWNATGPEDNGERFRLRSLAYAIEKWHENSGAFARMDIDPLPHQIHLVHKILSSGDLNWMIADDVGLGKTIEVGMLISALTGKSCAKRILLVVPAGLVNQWKDELHFRFGLSNFQVYGDDFNINENWQWKIYDHVIASVDRLKSDTHIAKFLEAPPWDLVVFDEAHRLTRSRTGNKFKSSQRYRLAARLRKEARAILLLTATPHQGKTDRFQALLELLRPELKQKIRRIHENPEILSRMIIRNSKADAVDHEGNPIFKRCTTYKLAHHLSPEEKQLDRALRRYFLQGYEAGSATGNQGRAIGFVMTVYRKLATSSIAAIESALEHRLRKVENQGRNHSGIEAANVFEDERFFGEMEEKIEVPSTQFFQGERQMIEKLLGQARSLKSSDSKLKFLLDEIIQPILRQDSSEKIVVFTEYRSTQAWLASALKKNFGQDAVAIINGSMDHKERAQAIAAFEDHASFLISTEAGGEGINLHRKCHIMVNYDLPWNPMRLVQRIGRLYRYGQKRDVLVFNIHTPDALDGKVVSLLYSRIEQVVKDLSSVADEFRPGLEAEIIGELTGLLDIETILAESAGSREEGTLQQMDKALDQAKTALKKQREMLAYAAGYNPDELKDEFFLDQQHVWSFVKGMLPYLHIETVETKHNGDLLRIRLPDELSEKLGTRKKQINITSNRDLASGRSDVELMDMDSSLFKVMVKHAKHYNFDGRVALISSDSDQYAIITAMLRWQNEEGRRMRSEFVVCSVDSDGKTSINPKNFSNWLRQPVGTCIGGPSLTKEEIEKILSSASITMDKRLESVASNELHPENSQLIGLGVEVGHDRL